MLLPQQRELLQLLVGGKQVAFEVKTVEAGWLKEIAQTPFTLVRPKSTSWVKVS